MNQPEAFDFKMVKDLEIFMLSTIPDKEALKVGSLWRFGNSIFNAILDSIDKPDRNRATARNTSTNLLLTCYMKTGEIRVKFAKRRAPLDVR